MENRKDKFKRLATSRVSRALKDIQLIGNLSNRSNYDYDEEDVEKIFRALNNELKACRARFDSEDRDRKIDFTL